VQAVSGIAKSIRLTRFRNTRENRYVPFLKVGIKFNQMNQRDAKDHPALS
jgi:hypothetical protein